MFVCMCLFAHVCVCVCVYARVCVRMFNGVCEYMRTFADVTYCRKGNSRAQFCALADVMPSIVGVRDAIDKQRQNSRHSRC